MGDSFSPPWYGNPCLHYECNAPLLFWCLHPTLQVCICFVTAMALCPSSIRAVPNHKFQKSVYGCVYKHLLRRLSSLVSIRNFLLPLQGQMKVLVNELGKDPEQKFKASNRWTGNFMRRKGLSVQKKTGKKHRPAAELLPVKSFHWYSIYKIVKEAP